MKISSSLASIIALQILPAYARTRCNEGFALLSVSYSVTEDEWDELYKQIPPKLKIRPSLNADGEYTSFDDVNDFELCVPKLSDCFQVTIEVFAKYSYQISWDGQIVETGLESTYLGYPSTTTEIGENCVPYCDEETESLVEFFMDREEFKNCSTYPYFNWQLDTAGPENHTTPLHVEGVIPSCNNRLLVHEIMCVPKGACASFQISSDRLHPANTAYALTMDGISYRSKPWYLSRDQNQRTHMGNCTIEQICNEDKDALFELEIRTSEEPELFPESFGAPSSNAVFWFLDPYILSGVDYIGLYSFDSVYRTIECVPEEQCALDFGITIGPFVANYTIKRNGEEQSSRYIQSRYDWDETNYTYTAFGDDCYVPPEASGSLSSASVVGILFACVFACHAIFGYFWCKKRKASKVKPEDEEAPMDDKASTDSNSGLEYSSASFESHSITLQEDDTTDLVLLARVPSTAAAAPVHEVPVSLVPSLASVPGYSAPIDPRDAPMCLSSDSSASEDDSVHPESHCCMLNQCQ
mmetsp:Transcript_22337/g.32987  ORF Transcript_22337/g.32987 Transcript_22337/m.32987 type:complete len:526 (+) Transcript_22337:287-1864(+)